MSLQNHILEHLRYHYPEWISGVELQRLAQDKYFGDRYYSGETASRGARMLVNWKKPQVEKKKDGQLVYYRYKPTKLGVLNEKYGWSKQMNAQREKAERSRQARLV